MVSASSGQILICFSLMLYPYGIEEGRNVPDRIRIR